LIAPAKSGQKVPNNAIMLLLFYAEKWQAARSRCFFTFTTQ